MVTHNPDIECYADRLLYIADGKFVEQVVNAEQTRLNYEDYAEYLKRRDQQQDDGDTDGGH